MPRLRFVLPILLFASLILTSCAPIRAGGASFLSPTLSAPAEAPSSTATARPTQAPLPAATALPTQTLPPPTETLSPTPTQTPLPTPSITLTAAEPVTTLLFTGIIVPARCVQARIDELNNPNYPYEEVRELISSADLAVGTLNATMSDRTERTGCMDTFQLVGRADNADALQWAGFDLMSVATNHIMDCGLMKVFCVDVFLDTLENLRRVGIPYTGAGENLEEALQPVIITLNGIRFGFVSLGNSKQREQMFALDDRPGIAELVPENLETAMRAVRQSADVVIALPHWGPEYSISPNWEQQVLARQFIAEGADLVVGNHTHVIQARQEIDGVPVFYGLGNFVFDQVALMNRQSIILKVTFRGTKLESYELIPIHSGKDGRAHISSPEEAGDIMHLVELVSQGLHP